MSKRDDDLIRGRNAIPAPATAPAQSPEAVETAAIRARQHGRARVMALLLGAFVVLVFGIAIVKIKNGMG